MKDFTLYPEALELKQLGFDEPCLGYYSDKTGEDKTIYTVGTVQNSINSMSVHLNTNCRSYEFSSPTYAQAFRWFRDKHNLHHMLNPFNRVEIIERDLVEFISFGYAIQDKVVGRTDFKTHEEAELACLRKLIEIVKEGNKWQE